MAGITGQGTTFNLPNYTGQLFSITPQDTPLLSAIGGLTGGQETLQTGFDWQYFDLRDADSARQRVEGADAPTAEERVRSNARNVVEIHQEKVEVSYTKQAATAQLNVNASAATVAQGSVTGSNPVTNEADWQITQQIRQVARDVEVSFISGTFNEPTSNSTARRTRGLVQAIEAGVGSKNNRVNAADLPLTKTMVLNAMQSAYDNGGLMEDETRTILVPSVQKRALTTAFINATDGYRFETRNVGGVNVQTIETDFGTLNVVLDRHIPTDTVLILSLEELAPVFLNVPGKGHFFVEPLAKTGASEKFQLYGEIGLRYGNPLTHAVIDNLGGYTS